MDANIIEQAYNELNEEGLINEVRSTEIVQPNTIMTTNYRLSEDIAVASTTPYQLPPPRKTSPDIERVKKLISDTQGLLWKIEEYEYNSTDTDDKDLKDQINKLYKESVAKMIGRAKEIWDKLEAPVAAPVATAPVTPAPEVTVTVDPTPTAPMALQIAKSESLVSPNGAEYIVEGNEIKIVVRAKDGNIYKVDYATALKWKK